MGGRVIVFFNRGEISKIFGLLLVGGLLFYFYINFITYRGELKGDHTLFVKFDGKIGTVEKIENKYLKEMYSIKNSKNLDYGYYTVKFRVRKVISKNGFHTMEGKILGYRSGILNKFRRYVLKIFDELFITEQNLYAFSRASILGEKAEVSKTMNDKFKYTGLAHLVVISGSHISLVIMGIVQLLDIVNLNYKAKYLLAMIVLSVYCAMVGMSPGILRAYIMGIMMIIARIIFEEEDVKKSLNISLIIILILNPYAIFDISMQLSYMAVIAIVYVYPVINQILKKRYFDKMKDGIIKESIQLTVLSLIIQVTSIPLFLYYFEKLPLFSFLLNIIGVPIGTILVNTLFGVTLINVLGIKFFNPILSFITKVIYGAFEGFIFLGAKIPLLQIEMPKASIYFVIIYYILLYMGLKFLSKKTKNMI